MSSPSAPARSPLIAVILSLAATGLGQIYCGRIVRGLVMFLSSLLFVPATVVAALMPPSTVVLVGLILALLTVLGVYVLAVVDAFRLAALSFPHPAGDDGDRALLIVVHGSIPLGNGFGAGEGICAVHTAFSHEAGLCNSQKPVTFFLPLAKRRKKIACVFRMAAAPCSARNIWHPGVDGSRSTE